ncbi:MAG: orotate phosphoribosyltransferase [Pseudomonadota bacterium]
MDKPALAQRIVDAAYLTGSFTLRSGQTSDFYFDKYRFEALPALLDPIATHMAKLIPPQTEVLAGLELGGVPIATALSLKTGLPAVFVRKERKDYGTCRIAEGIDFAGKRVTVVEDVITTGGQVIASAQDLRDEGAIVSDVLCALLRADEGIARLQIADLTLHPLFRLADMPIPD